MTRQLITIVLVLLSFRVFAQEDFALHISSEVPSLKIPADLRAEIVLQNPLVANPLYMHFDARGRMWLIEYRQYPWPAGLKLLSRDAVWRNRYEPPFAPPPPHAEDSPFRGRDRISIHEDTNGDGQFDKSKIFLDGLNFATAALPGRGGVFVMNPPYLLFYADRNKDDVPDDKEPRVLLSGFGIEDSHSIANSLRWGPDGWIYATQGSTVSGSIVRHDEDNKPIPGEGPIHSLGQNLWRYHPEKHKYEVFAEGGGNAFGVEIDGQGRPYSGHNGGNTRGFHYVQGGYYQKTFGKHGDLSNRYAYGYFPDMNHHDVKRFTHTFVIYEADELPERYHGKLFGVNPVENYLIHSSIEADGSSKKTTDIATIVEPGDGDRADWFTPVDVQVGPDGALYLADWFSMQSNHYRNHEGETNPELGRVIRIRGKSKRDSSPFDLEALPSEVLIDRYLSHPNRWYRHQVLRILGDRKDKSVRSKLLDLVRSHKDQLSLDAFWALNLSGGLDADLACEFLDHPNEHVRRWTVRFCGDEESLQDHKIVSAIVARTAKESSSEVVSQIICSARRMQPNDSHQVIAAVLERDDFANDIHIPLLVWWAIEAIADEDIEELLANTKFWTSRWKPNGQSFVTNLMKRCASKQDASSLAMATKLLRLAPGNQQNELTAAFLEASKGQSLTQIPNELAVELAKSEGILATLLAIRQGDATQIDASLLSLGDAKTSESDATQLIDALGAAQANPPKTVARLFELLKSQRSDTVKAHALVALQQFARDEIGPEVLKQRGDFKGDLADTAESLLASRSVWAKQTLQAIQRGDPGSRKLLPETVAKMRLHKDNELQLLLDSLFPMPATDDLAFANRTAVLMQTISQGQGQPLSGQSLFFSKANCGKCHQLFGKGGEIGPDLTPFNRTDLRNMLLSIVHPNAEIREGYENRTVITADGQAISGLLVESNDRVVVLRGADGQDHVVEQDNIEDMSAAKNSLMPSHLLDALTDDEIRDLFAYLVSTTPPK